MNIPKMRKITAFGETKSVLAWSKDARCKVSRKGLERRLDAGWPAERAISAIRQSPPGRQAGFTAHNKNISPIPELNDANWVRGFSKPTEIVDRLGCSYTAARNAMIRFNCFKAKQQAKRTPANGRWLAAGLPVERAVASLDGRSSSMAEQELARFVEGLGVHIERNERNLIAPKEVDIYIPSHDLAIEFNGLHWHSDQFLPPTYHYDKFKDCQKAGVTLLQVWGDDWWLKRPVVESMIKHRLGVSDKPRLAARSTTFEPLVPKSEADRLLRENHVQGAAVGSIRCGLRSRTGELVAVAVFQKSNTVADWLLARFATDRVVVGGFTKLLKGFRRDHTGSIKTFADLTISTGNMYRLAGFREDKLFPPDYRYVVENQRVHKFGLRKDRFNRDVNLVYQEGLSERELAELNNIPRIYDAGKLRFVLD